MRKLPTRWLVIAVVAGAGALPFASMRPSFAAEKRVAKPGGPNDLDDDPSNLVGGPFNWKKVRKRYEKLNWGNWQKGSVYGSGGACKTVDLSIRPVQNSHVVAPDQDPDYKHGLIVAELKNETQCDGVGIPLPAGHHAVWIVRYDSKNHGTSWVVDLDDTFLGITKEAFLKAKGWETGSCGVPDAPPNADLADIKRRDTQCNPPPDAQQTATLAARIDRDGGTFHPVAQDPDDGTLWFDCSLQCCYATADIH